MNKFKRGDSVVFGDKNGKIISDANKLDGVEGDVFIVEFSNWTVFDNNVVMSRFPINERILVLDK